MVNLDTIIKILRSRGFVTNWPEPSREMQKGIDAIKLGFPGIGNDHISLITYRELEVGNIFIIAPKNLGNIPTDPNDTAPIMLSLDDIDGDIWKCTIQGIGTGLDLGDPERNQRRWLDSITIDRTTLSPTDLCLRVDVRPKDTGGPGYYYFYKAYRDARS